MYPGTLYNLKSTGPLQRRLRSTHAVQSLATGYVSGALATLPCRHMYRFYFYMQF